MHLLGAAARRPGPTVMFILFFVIIFSSMGFGLVLPPFVFVAKNLGASEMLAGFIVSSFAMGQFLATPVDRRLGIQCAKIFHGISTDFHLWA